MTRNESQTTNAGITFSRRGAHFKWFVTGFALPLIGGLLAYNFSAVTPSKTSAPLIQKVVDQTLALPKQITQPLGDVVEKVVHRNDTLDRIFRQARLNLDDLAAIRALPGMRDSLDVLKPGELITLKHINGALQSLTRRLSDTELLSVNREPEGFTARTVVTPVEVRTISSHGEIETSLFSAARAAGISSDVIMRLANDVFGWDIDFALDIQEGDRFGIVYEQKFRDGEYLGDGQILAAEFVNQGHLYRAIRFASADGEIADYFTPEGNSMRKQFLRAPVEFKYVSSNFNPHRFHPILNIVRAHQGVDYAAPIGTPVRAAGDGRVVHAGVQGGYGNAIIIEHGGSVSTLYGHLSRFAKNLHTGERVKQGEVIGFVGSTGAATGPHLHYEYRINGVHKNPRTVALPEAQPIPPQYRAEFTTAKATLLSRLDALNAAKVAAQDLR